MQLLFSHAAVYCETGFPWLAFLVRKMGERDGCESSTQDWTDMIIELHALHSLPLHLHFLYTQCLLYLMIPVHPILYVYSIHFGVMRIVRETAQQPVSPRQSYSVCTVCAEVQTSAN